MTEIKIDIENSSQINEKIVIIGTGNYGIAIGKRLLHFGYNVIYGSRSPNMEYLRKCFDDLNTGYQMDVTSIQDAWNRADNLVFLAISADNYEAFVNEVMNNPSDAYYLKSSKIIIEISNLKDSQNLSNLKTSNAEKLDSLFKLKIVEHNLNLSIHVVKGFNLINANSISLFLYGSDKTSLTNFDLAIPVAGDDIHAKQKVFELCSKIGLKANDVGLLKSSLKLELANKLTFDEWKSPTSISLVYFLTIFVWQFFHNFIFTKKPTALYEYFQKISLMSLIIKSSGFTSLYLLAFVYLGYVIACIYQLKFGTKYKKFPTWLDKWLKSRKQFGLLAFMFATVHVVLSLVTINPQYSASWFQKTGNFTYGKMTLNGEINTLTGVFSYLLLILLALSSINSIANSLNWNEWNLVQTKIGLFCLFLGALHCFAMFLRQFSELTRNDLGIILTRTKLIAILFPCIVLILRLMFGYFRPLSKKIEDIRKGKKAKIDKA